MNVYEQQARALKEIAVELKGVRRALDIICKSLEPEKTIASDDADQVGEQAIERAGVLICGINNEPCTYCNGKNCVYQTAGGAGNG